MREDVVELPPFIITENAVTRPWVYAEADGFEIISQCSEESTQQVFAALWRGQRLTLPPELHPRTALPIAVVLFDQKPDDAAGPGKVLGSSGGHLTNVIKRTLHDREVFSVNLNGRDFEYATTFRFHIRTLLALHTPTAPRWLREALNGPYGIYDDIFFLGRGSDKLLLGPVAWPEPVSEFAPADRIMPLEQLWGSFVRSAPVGPRPTTRPVAANDIVEMPAFVVSDTVDRERWAATCGLLAHWAILADDGAHRDAFWRFAIRASEEPVTEELFRECFGLNYQEARKALGRHLLANMKKNVAMAIAPLQAPQLTIRPATGAEIARLRGEFERGEALILAKRYPDLAAKYREKAARTLNRGLDAAAKDFQIEATLGLVEFELGRIESAVKHLEAAAAAGSLRPRAAVVLAQLRFVEASKTLAAPTDPFSAEQTAAVLQPLQDALNQMPKMTRTYELLADLWRRSPELPTAETLRRLAEGQRAFPGNTQLALSSARACFERGHIREARELLDRSLKFCTDPTMEARLTQTLARMPAGN